MASAQLALTLLVVRRPPIAQVATAVIADSAQRVDSQREGRSKLNVQALHQMVEGQSATAKVEGTLLVVRRPPRAQVATAVIADTAQLVDTPLEQAQ